MTRINIAEYVNELRLSFRIGKHFFTINTNGDIIDGHPLKNNKAIKAYRKLAHAQDITLIELLRREGEKGLIQIKNYEFADKMNE